MATAWDWVEPWATWTLPCAPYLNPSHTEVHHHRHPVWPPGWFLQHSSPSHVKGLLCVCRQKRFDSTLCFRKLNSVTFWQDGGGVLSRMTTSCLSELFPFLLSASVRLTMRSSVIRRETTQLDGPITWRGHSIGIS